MRSALHQGEQRLFTVVTGRLSTEVWIRLDALVTAVPGDQGLGEGHAGFRHDAATCVLPAVRDFGIGSGAVPTNSEAGRPSRWNRCIASTAALGLWASLLDPSHNTNGGDV